VYLSALGTWVSPSKTAVLIKVTSGGLTNVLDWGRDLTNPFTAMRSDTTVMQPLAKSHRTPVVIIYNSSETTHRHIH